GTTEKIDTFVGLMRQIGLVEIGRTGVVGLIRGKDPI
ncbi:MAG: acetolactate synthase small subunit, partial [Sphingobium sp.]